MISKHHRQTAGRGSKDRACAARSSGNDRSGPPKHALSSQDQHRIRRAAYVCRADELLGPAAAAAAAAVSAP